MNQKRNALLKGLTAIAAVIVICVSIARIAGIGSQTLGDIAREHPQPTSTPAAESETTPGTEHGTEREAEPGTERGTAHETESGTERETVPGTVPETVPDSQAHAYDTENPDAEENDSHMETEHLQNPAQPTDGTPLTGLSLNGELMTDARSTWAEGFYHEPLSGDLVEYITGTSYPEGLEDPAVLAGDLSYVHVLYCDFEGNTAQGELICNQDIAQDLVEIFHELYRAEYRIEKIRLIDEYGGDDDLSMADNNTSCFNYRVVSGSSSLSRHAYGLAIDVNPLYNPYITYNRDHTINVAPAAGEDYADRSKSFPYKIDEDDLCCRLFKEHGFIWGGDWNSCKDYQHFQKTP